GHQRGRAAAAALRHRRRGGLGRRPALRRRDRRLGRALRAVSGVAGNGKGLSPQGEFASIARSLGRGALVTVMRGPNLGARMLVRVDGSTEGSLGDDALERAAVAHADELMWAERSERREEGDVLLFVDVVFPAPRLVI